MAGYMILGWRLFYLRTGWTFLHYLLVSITVKKSDIILFSATILFNQFSFFLSLTSFCFKIVKFFKITKKYRGHYYNIIIPITQHYYLNKIIYIYISHISCVLLPNIISLYPSPQIIASMILYSHDGSFVVYYILHIH